MSIAPPISSPNRSIEPELVAGAEPSRARTGSCSGAASSGTSSGLALDRHPRDPDRSRASARRGSRRTRRTRRTCSTSDMGPSLKHPFGTDDLGRDQLSRDHVRGPDLADDRPRGRVALDDRRRDRRRGRRLLRQGDRPGPQRASPTSSSSCPTSRCSLSRSSIFGQNATSIIFVLAALGWMYMARDRARAGARR